PAARGVAGRPGRRELHDERPRRSRLDPVNARQRIGSVLGLILLIGVVLLVNRLGSTPDPVADPTVRSSASASASASASRTASTSRTTAPSTRDPDTGLRLVDLASLPKQAQQTVALIQRGGPYPYAKDGATFGNRERILPNQRSGYYREYTVITPGEGDRGARRIVTGDADRIFFYTADHYDSFVRIRP
ncbi:MAG TPA: ribonuclease domain-containing protein, partial [Propionibacteriaceae bacterium]